MLPEAKQSNQVSNHTKLNPHNLQWVQAKGYADILMALLPLILALTSITALRKRALSIWWVRRKKGAKNKCWFNPHILVEMGSFEVLGFFWSHQVRLRGVLMDPSDFSIQCNTIYCSNVELEKWNPKGLPVAQWCWWGGQVGEQMMIIDHIPCSLLLPFCQTLTNTISGLQTSKGLVVPDPPSVFNQRKL